MRYFERAAHKLAIEEEGGELDESFERDFEDLRRKSVRISSAETSENGASSYFLVIFDAKHGTLVSETRIVDSDEAMNAFAEAERQHGGKPDLQVVMFSADSIETVHGTHPHYFKGSAGPSTDPFGYTPVATAP